MKELESFKQDKQLEGIEIREEQEKKNEYRLVRSERRIRGHIVWEYDRDTKILRRAKQKKTDVLLTSLDPEAINTETIHSYEFNPDCEYLQALNRKNAIKHLKKAGYSEFREEENP
jgi:hypothetical protein